MTVFIMTRDNSRLKSRALENLKNTYCMLKPSGINIGGVGVFAIRDISEGIDPFPGIVKPRWYAFTPKELSGLPDVVQKMVKNFGMVEDDGRIWAPHYGINGMDMSFYVNHSETPNLTANKEATIFLTNRKIITDEELVLDYRTFSADWKK